MRGITASDSVEVDLGARAAWPGVPHLPEVVLHIAGDDPNKKEVLIKVSNLFHRKCPLKGGWEMLTCPPPRRGPTRSAWPPGQAVGPWPYPRRNRSRIAVPQVARSPSVQKKQ